MTNNISKSEKDLSLYHLPPHSIETEESILSAILIDNSTLLDVVPILSSNDFYKSSHQIIYSSIIALFSKNEPVDLVTLTNALKQRGHLKEIGGAAYLARIFDTAPMAANAQHYAKIIHDKASLRRLIEKANAISRKCFEDSGNVDETIDFAESAIFEISSKKSKKAFYPIHELINKNIDALEERQGNKTLITGVPTGFKMLDNLTSGFQNSDFIIIAARPSMGKTALALNIARNAAVDSNIPSAVFSLEMSKEQLSMRLLCSEARIDSSRLRSGFFSKEDWVHLTDAAGILSEAPIYIDDTPDISALEIRAKARRLKMEVDLGLVIIDYLQLLRSHHS